MGPRVSPSRRHSIGKRESTGRGQEQGVLPALAHGVQKRRNRKGGIGLTPRYWPEGRVERGGPHRQRASPHFPVLVPPSKEVNLEKEARRWPRKDYVFES